MSTPPMNTPPNVVPESPVDSPVRAAAAISASRPRPMCWSVRRELWENRSIYIAPLAVAGVMMFAFLITLRSLPHEMLRESGRQPLMLAMPFSHSAWLLVLTAFIVAVFYSLDALYGERRDRSILFWKSMPVSDLTTVLSKAAIPLVVIPLVTFAIILATQVIMVPLSAAVLMGSGGGATALWWTRLPLFQLDLVYIYGLAVITLWYAPIYGWLLLISVWARRTTLLWAVLPLLVIGVFERLAFHTWYIALLAKDRLIGFAAPALAFMTPEGVPVDPHFIPLAQLTPGKFLSAPGLWIGLAFAAIFLAVAVRLRRYREPI
jgi:ABC-2 type transport system permease protein